MVPALRNKIGVLLGCASQSAAATRSATLDCLGADYATISIPMNIEVNTNAIGPTIVLSEGDTTSSFATWSSSCTLTAHGLETAHQVRFDVDMRARKRYLKLLITAETTTNDHVTAAAVSMLSRRAEVPAGTAGLIGSTNDTVVVL
jgi:hypothetical protein